MAKKEYVSKYAPKWYTFPRETTTYREFENQKEAEEFKEKIGNASIKTVRPERAGIDRPFLGLDGTNPSTTTGSR